MARYVFDYRKLKGRITEVYGSRKKFAEAMGSSPATISNKLSNKSYFTQKDIQKAADLLGLTSGSIASYFFAPKL